MKLDLPTLVPLALFTVRHPREGAQRLMALNLGRDVLWQLLLLVVAVSVILAELSNILLGLVYGAHMQAVFAGPIALAGIQLALLVTMVFAIFWVGRAMGGTGRFEDALLLVAWLQFILACLQVVQTVALLLVPPLAWLIGLFGLGLFLYLLTHFVAAMHGFRSLSRVFAAILLALFALAVALSILLTLAGVPIPEVSNV